MPSLSSLSSVSSSLPHGSMPSDSSVRVPPLCHKTSVIPLLRRPSNFCASRSAQQTLRHRCCGFGSSRSVRARTKLDLVEKRLGLKVENVAPAPAAYPAITSEVTAGHSDTFLTVTTEKELLLGIRREVESKRIPQKAGYAMEELYCNYKDAVLEGKVGQEIIVKVMATVLDRILLQFEEPFTFPSYHKAIREPYDYYTFGQNYTRHLLDFRNSFLGNASRFDEIEDRLKQGHNVVLLANHQTEADPAVMALLLESSHPYIAQTLTYIAGDRVILDPFCRPFSMGRNLVCVYSKKHINDEPNLVDMKVKANARALKELAVLLREGGQLVWIAPSGGRDRPDPATLKWKPALFDAGSVENIRRLIDHSKAPGHMYPLALLSYGIMPPPTKIEKEIGEKRLLGFTGAGMSAGAELHFKDITVDCKSRDEAAECFAQVAWQRVNEQYVVLSGAVEYRESIAASTNSVMLSQPWTKNSLVPNEDSWRIYTRTAAPKMTANVDNHLDLDGDSSLSWYHLIAYGIGFAYLQIYRMAMTSLLAITIAHLKIMRVYKSGNCRANVYSDLMVCRGLGRTGEDRHASNLHMQKSIYVYCLYTCTHFTFQLIKAINILFQS